MNPTTTKHTPGPWRVHPWDHNIVDAYPHGGQIAEVIESKNARLIAAAPDLLDALRQCLPLLEEHARAALGEGELTIATVRAAIAQAEGREA